MRDRPAVLRPPRLWAAASLIAAAHAGFVLARGAVMAPDSRAYAYWSGRLVESGFDYPGLLAEASFTFPPILYALFASLLAVLRLAFGSEWANALVALNFVTHVALGVLIVRLAARLTGSGVAAWGALLLFLGCFDLLMWVPLVLSDATFVFLAFTIFALAAGRILDKARSWLAVLAPATAGIIYRPTGMVLLPDLAWAFYLSRMRTREVRRGPVLAILAAMIAAGMLAFAWFMQDPGRWPFDTLSGAFRSVAREYAAGEVVSARPETYHSPPRTLLDFVLISADRFVHFFAIGAASFSAVHWLVQLAFFLPCYALAGWLGAALWLGRTGFGAPERKVFLAAFGAVLSYAVFHALVQVDFDWRYRTPILPHLILLAAGGLADLARRRTAR
jgi:multisubunit Na+/H+ antiporter MnhF subunit